MSTLRKGSSGTEVREAQRLLNLAGAGLTVDGKYGQKTVKAVKDFQTKNALNPDGVIGSLTWAKLRDLENPVTIINECIRDIQALPSFNRFMELMQK